MRDQNVPDVPEGGNNKTTKKVDSPSLHWCFTLNNYTLEDIDKLKQEPGVKSLVFQTEVGEKGTPHLQGYIGFENKIRFNQVTQFLPRARWDKTKKIKYSIEYCRKDDTFDGKCRYEKGVPKKARGLTTLIKSEQLYDWQKDLLEIIQGKPNDRIIYWTWERVGNKGKTSFCKYLAYHHNAIYINGGKGSDILHVVAEALNKNTDSNLIIFDFPRTLEGKVSYAAIEAIKNGFFTSTKYEGGTVMMDPPHVLIFANWAPLEDSLSQDRWDIMDLNEEPILE